jgi:hypothetical protein
MIFFSPSKRLLTLFIFLFMQVAAKPKVLSSPAVMLPDIFTGEWNSECDLDNYYSMTIRNENGVSRIKVRWDDFEVSFRNVSRLYTTSNDVYVCTLIDGKQEITVYLKYQTSRIILANIKHRSTGASVALFSCDQFNQDDPMDDYREKFNDLANEVFSSKSERSRFPGVFPQASLRLLSEEEVARLSNEQLSLMRNEIFARHGYIFKTRKWIDHFSRQSWYRPLYSDVNNLLSRIEKANINLIKRYEKM